MRGRFITFEGLDGCGKSTQLRLASEWLSRLAVAHRVTHEPGGTPLGEAIRSVFLNEPWEKVDGTVEALLIFASRRQHLLEIIDPLLEAGVHVLCDRFTDSTMAYQGFGRGVPLPLLERIDELATGGREADATLLFDLPAAAARERGHSAERSRSGGGVDRLDAEAIDFYERVRQGYVSLARNQPNRFTIIDASGRPEEIQREVQAALSPLVEERD